MKHAVRLLMNLYDAWDAAAPGNAHAEKSDEWRLVLSALE